MLAVTVAAAAAPVVAALATNPTVRQEARRVGRLARPLRRSVALAPVPPRLPPGRVINLPGRGEVFVRDSGGHARGSRCAAPARLDRER